MGFEFIDSTAPVDQAARQRIRRQAALGKNLGRKLNRPSRKQALKPHLVPTRATIDSSENSNQQEQQEQQSQQQPKAQKAKSDVVEVVEAVRLPTPDNQIGNTLTQLQFKKIGPDSLVMNAISFVLQAPRSADHGIGKAVHVGKVPLFSRFMFQDEAYFHSTIALSLRALGSRPEASGLPSIMAIQHMARSLQLINSRFAKSQSVSDINIAVVVVMTQYTRMSGQLSECRIHLDGLERMVQLRGGINAIKPELAEKIFRTDIGCAYHLTAPTRFTMDEVEQFSQETIGPDGILPKSHRVITRASVQPSLVEALSPTHQNIFLDATRFTVVLDEAYAGKREWLTISNLHQATLYIGYQIVRGPPSGPANENSDVDLLTRLGLVAFCLSFFRSFDARIIHSSPLGFAIHRVVQGLKSRGAWTEELVLWTLLMGHVLQIFGDDLWPDVMRRAKQCVEVLKLDSWRDATQMLTRYPWSDALVGSTGKVMWDMLMLMPKSTTIGSTAVVSQFDVPVR